MLLSIWITGPSRSGKTTRLVNEFSLWIREKLGFRGENKLKKDSPHPLVETVLVLAANDDNRQELVDRLTLSLSGSYPVICKTPLGFISDEVMLFWPLLFEQLSLKAQFPLRLRPETEQELATRLWRSQLDLSQLEQTGVSESRFVRRTLDLLQLSGASGIPAEDIPYILEQGFSESILETAWTALIRQDDITSREEGNGALEEYSSLLKGVREDENSWKKIGQLILDWKQWCLERGLLTYGLIYELYWRYLLPNPKYQHHLISRYPSIFADDVDDYPAITRQIFDFLLDQGAFAVFTYNPDGQVRVGLGADPQAFVSLANRCEVEELPLRGGLALEFAEPLLQMISDPIYLTSLPEQIQSLQTISRAQLLRKTGEFIIHAIKEGEIEPQEVAVIAPGLDEIARYTLMEILKGGGVPVYPLNEQRPLISSPLVRALLTLLGLVYPGLGRLVWRDDVAEMLVILSRQPRSEDEQKRPHLVPEIDPVRAGLITDYCYHIDPEKPHLLAVETFPRWDRLGHRTTEAYNRIRAWIDKTKELQQQQKLTTPIYVLDQAIKDLLNYAHYLPYEQLSALRELMETAQHYWEVERRVRQNEPVSEPLTTAIAQFILLLRKGTITANPRPLKSLGNQPKGVILANIFQYRSLRSFHRWQFWLDASSSLWDKAGSATLFAAPLFLTEWHGRTLTPEDEFEMDQERLKRILRDLLGRVGEKVFLCHSDLGVTGTEHGGPLLSLVHSSKEIHLGTNGT